MTARAEPRPIDFRRPPQLPLASWRVLQEWQHGVTTRTVESWNRHLPQTLTMRFTGAEHMPARDLETTLADPGWGAELHIGAERFTSMFAASRKLVLALTGSLVGAVGAEWPEARPLSTVETALAQLLMRDFAAAAAQAWLGDDPLPVSLESTIERPVRTRTFPAHARTLVLKLVVESVFGTDRCWWVFPERALTTLLARCEPGAAPQRSAPPPAGVSHVVERMPVQLAVHLGQTHLTMAQLADLSVGDLLVLSQPVSEPLVACVSGRPKYRGWPGRVGAARAFQIESEWAPAS